MDRGHLGCDDDRLVRAMTRCECAELPFDELVRRARSCAGGFDTVQAETGAGLLCTACLPDLRRRLEAAGLSAPGGPMPVSPEEAG
jgi:hypothetical protein